MNRLLTGFIFICMGIAIGYFAQPHIRDMLMATGLVGMEEPGSSGSSGREILYWVAPMDANYRRDKPGQSPMGMDLVPVYADEAGSEAGVVKINPTVENNLGVRTRRVEKGMLDRSIDTVGYIGFDEEKIFHVHTRVEGWVERLLVKAEGEAVKKGQKLFEIYSPDLVNAQEEYLTALKSNNRILVDASRTRLRSLGIENSQIERLTQSRKIHQRIDYSSAHNGFINALNIREGMFVKPATDVLSIGQLDSVWVIAEVFEQQSGLIRIGQQVSMSVSALPGESWNGEVDYIYPVLDANTRTLRVRVRFANPDRRLKLNMYAQLQIAAASDRQTLYIPREALIRSGRMDRVVLALGDGEYKSVAVRTGIESDHFIEILEGLSEQDRVVTSAQFLIDSESSLTAEFERMEEMPSMEQNEMQSEDADQIWVNGKLSALMADRNMMTVQHEPVDAWGWPQMVMDFPVAEDVAIKHLNDGDEIRFLVRKLDSGGIRIVDIDDDRIAWVKGSVNQVHPDQQKVNLHHEPVDVWGWPSMMMDFPVAEDIDFKQFEKDRELQVLVQKNDNGSIRIIDVKQEQ